MTSRLVSRVMVPPIAGFVIVATYVSVEALGFRGLARPEAETVSEAAALGHAARALQLIASGQNPNTLLHIREGIVDRDGHDLTPIDAAILGRHAELVRLLQRSGVTHADSARTACFARMRLPEVLADVGASDAGGADGNADVATAITTCGEGRAP
jgi:hypothetical protein